MGRTTSMSFRIIRAVSRAEGRVEVTEAISETADRLAARACGKSQKAVDLEEQERVG